MASAAPPAYSHSTVAASIQFPDVPTTALVLPPPNQPRPLSHNDNDALSNSNNTLPPLSSVTGGQPLALRGDAMMNHSPHPVHSWPPLNPIASYFPSPGQTHQAQHAHRLDSPSTMDLDASSNSVASAASPDRHMDGRASSVNLDDPDVRLAAEALGDLRAGECG